MSEIVSGSLVEKYYCVSLPGLIDPSVGESSPKWLLGLHFRHVQIVTS